MLSQFPIFLDLHQTPPLVIGDDSGLAAKLRLLRKAAPIVDVMVSHHAEWPDQFADDSGARFHRFGKDVLLGRDHDQRALLHDSIKGRPLAILETGEATVNRALVATARHYGVPVNVPDQIDLCSFYLASIVDRAPLVIAISTSGQAPVLGQVIRARLESMLAPHYGKLAVYLNQLRPRLAGLAPAWRRQLQRQIVTGSVGHAILQNDPHHADQLLDVILEKGDDRADDKAGHFAVIGYGSGDVTLLSLGAGEAIRGADLVFHDQQTPADILEIARREANFIKTDDALSANDLAGYLFGHLSGHCGDATKLDKNIVWLGAGYSEAHQMLLVHLRSLGVTVDYWPAAQPAAIDDLPVLLPTNRSKPARVKAGLASKIIKVPMASMPAAHKLRHWRGKFQSKSQGKFHDGDRP